MTTEEAPGVEPQLSTDSRRNVFVVHGRNSKARREVFDFLRALDLKPLAWGSALEMTGEGAPFIGTVLKEGMSRCQAILVLMTPDELVQLKPEFLKSTDGEAERMPAGQARPNVLFEAGAALALYPERTLIVEFGEVRSLSDIDGRYIYRLRDTKGARSALVEGLRRVRCLVDTSSSDWLYSSLTTPETEPSKEPAVPVPPVPVPAQPPTPSTGPLILGVPNVSRRSRYHVVHGEVTNQEQRSITAELKVIFYGDTGILGSAGGFVEVEPGVTKVYEFMTPDQVEAYTKVVPQVSSILN
ncbi:MULTISPECIES: nucleotide-binding protein [Actinosynnema]|uniref:TIR domain-containing protein n=1 Tax=Actinosynnema TaxID=40566 RepID=UPI0020A58C6B|nr:nucleotide-binding protein [Actinosynnema pretiosum]MCP2095002.1 putative nucleotide-binding protein containing TIR-like domain-containing protein [Actinosynnema pretiosum]